MDSTRSFNWAANTLPVCNASEGLFPNTYIPDFSALNDIYRRAAETIRKVDTRHILFLEGDLFASRYSSMDTSFDDTIVCSSHNYTDAGFGPGAYPGVIAGEYWDSQTMENKLIAHEGFEFAQQRNLPLWVGEFGPALNGPAEEKSDRLRAVSDQIALFNRYGIHWTAWTYKDMGVMGWVSPHPESEYMQRIKHVLKAKTSLSLDFWMQWMPQTNVTQLIHGIAQEFERFLPTPIDSALNERFLRQNTLEVYGAALLQDIYVQVFQDLTEAEIDRTLESLSFSQCIVNEAYVDMLARHMKNSAKI